MRRFRIIPVLLIDHNGSLVKTRQFKNPVYIGDPINTVKIFNDKYVDEIVLLNISASKHGNQPNFKLLGEIVSEAFIPLAYGGGINNIETASKIIDLGVEKIILNTAAYEQPELIYTIAKKYGSQSIMVSLDVRKGIFGSYHLVLGNGKKIKCNLIDYIKSLENHGAGEIFLTDTDREGTFKGYNQELIRNYTEFLKIPLIANGGAGGNDDFIKAIQAGASAVAAGSRFVYTGKTNGILVNYPNQKELISMYLSYQNQL